MDINAKLMNVAVLPNISATVVYTIKGQFSSRVVRNIAAKFAPTQTMMKGTIRRI